ncbi:CRISPR-associated endoribonuclease Cas6 [bacterium]|nr:CRISPR-associated endoribonuclease Cas6 [bacterium]
MRLILQFQKDGVIELPIHYNYIIQSLIYRYMGKGLGDLVHNKGFPYEKRSYKFFTFSRLLGKSLLKGDKILFTPPVKFIFSSPKLNILENFAENIISVKEIPLGGNEVYLEGIEVKLTPALSGSVKIRMLSPMTIYSTLTDVKGRKKTYYYTPWEKDFSLLMRDNLRRKYEALYGRSGEGKEFEIKPLKVKKEDEKIVIYKGTVIKGWMGIYEIEGDSELMRLAYEAGLGAKNPQGFGCIEIVAGRG